jgi:hypothetical protein
MTQKQQVANLSAPKPNSGTGLRLMEAQGHQAKADYPPNRDATIYTFHMPALGHIAR